MHIEYSMYNCIFLLSLGFTTQLGELITSWESVDIVTGIRINYYIIKVHFMKIYGFMTHGLDKFKKGVYFWGLNCASCHRVN